MVTQTYIGVLTVLQCWKCGVTFGITSDFETRRRNDHEGFSCPSGHLNYFNGKSKAEKLEQELAQQNERIDYLRKANDSLHHTIMEKNYSIRAQKAAKTRIMNRVKNGVCPCCNRTFQNLQGHFKT